MTIATFAQTEGWLIKESNIGLILGNDIVFITPADDETAVVRVRRGGMTVLLGVGLLRNDQLKVDLSFGRITFFATNGRLDFSAFTYEPGPSPSGGGTSEGPPPKT